MDIRYSGQNLRITKAVKAHIQDKLSNYEKYAPKLVEAHIILKKEKFLFDAEVTLLGKGLKAVGDAKSENLYTAIDDAYTKVVKQLKKFRGKKTDHHKKMHHKSSSRKKAMDLVDRDMMDLSSLPKIVKSRKASKKAISVEEASVKLLESGEPFIVFRNESTDHINVIKTRDDGKHEID